MAEVGSSEQPISKAGVSRVYGIIQESRVTEQVAALFAVADAAASGMPVYPWLHGSSRAAITSQVSAPRHCWIHVSGGIGRKLLYTPCIRNPMAVVWLCPQAAGL